MLENAAGAAGMQMLSDKLGDAMDYMQGGEQLADVTYWTRPAPLKSIVEQTLNDTVSGSLVALEYSRSVQPDEDLFVLATSSGSELRIVLREDSSFGDIRATQMVVEMEAARAVYQGNETLEFVEALQKIDSRTERRGIEKIRGDFNYAAGLNS
jgi:hypothetical protein